MKTAKAFHRNDHSVFQRVHSTVNCLLSTSDRPTVSVPKFHLRTAVRTGVGLCMKAAVERIFVFGAAELAHRKSMHARIHAIVRKLFEDRKTRAAIRAVGKRIMVPAV